MDHITRWATGDTIVMRGILKGKLWWASPAYVVQDSSEIIALYWPVGTPTKSPIRRPTVRDELENRVELEDRNWTDNNILSLNIPGAAYSIELMWEARTGSLRCWYVHLQEALRRSSMGFDTMDQMLDIVIRLDRTEWHWKDEDEFAEAEAIGVYSPEKAKAIRAEGERVIRRLRTNAAPFCDGWEEWRPPGGWTIPKFPDGWEKLALE
jgi:predicted RNA-binding protein associated with RNAse of E/G family